jgi:hypothetical protein
VVSAPADGEALECPKCGRKTLRRLPRASCKKPVRYSCENLTCPEHRRAGRMVGKVRVV